MEPHSSSRSEETVEATASMLWNKGSKESWASAPAGNNGRNKGVETTGYELDNRGGVDPPGSA
jgi:hypothetical protein